MEFDRERPVHDPKGCALTERSKREQAFIAGAKWAAGKSVPWVTEERIKTAFDEMFA